MTEITQEDMLRYLGGPYKQADIEYKSAYPAALIDARSITGRNKETGNIENYKETGGWAGALVYMALIDHIGGLFKIKNQNNNFTKGGDFTKALDYFTDLSEKKILALYALRCSFAHDYFLFNIPNNRDPLLMHLFSVCVGDSPLVALPSKKWGGLFSEINDRKTVVNLEKLGNMVEDIHSTLKDLIKKDNLEVVPWKEEYMSVNYVEYKA